MATARELYEAARRNQATMRRVETLMLREARSVLDVAVDFGQQEMGGYLRQTLPTLIDKWGNVNATAAVNYYNEQRRAAIKNLPTGSGGLARAQRRNVYRRADRVANAKLQAQVYVATKAPLKAANLSEPILGYGMQTFMEAGFGPMRDAVTSAMTRAVASYNRDTMLYNAGLDEAVVSVQRVAEPNACGFCQLMAFSSTRSASGDSLDVREADYAIDFHNNCRCSIETLYEGDEPIRPEYYAEFEANYLEASTERDEGQSVLSKLNQLARSN